MTWLSDRAIRHLQEVALWPDLEGTRYCAIEEIGRGGMGIVYRARDAVLGRDVALKVICAAGEHAALAARLAHEARVLARLEHPGIVPVHDAGVLADGRAFYVMKLVRGASLAEHLSKTGTPDGRLRVFERICEPVAFAHANGVVHRDLKPANVMVGSFGEVLVLDWGLARSVSTGALVAERVDGGPQPAAAEGADEHNTVAVADRAGPHARLPGTGPSADLTDAHTIVGTPGFMAPEQARAGAPVDARADVYALGAMLASMLTAAESAPPGSQLEPALRRHHVPARLRAICLKATASSPDDRYADAAALADDIARYRAGLRVSAHRETALERLARFVSTYRVPILLVLAYLVMRVLVAIYAALNPLVR